MSSKPKLLVISERGLGDALTLLPSLNALKAARPDLQIEMIAPGLSSLARNIKSTAEVIDHRPVVALTVEKKSKWLIEQGYTWIWNTENQKSVWRPIIEKAGNPKWISSLPHRKWPKRPVLDIRLQQLRALFPELAACPEPCIPLLDGQKELRASFRAQFPENHILVAIQPGGANPEKVWPAGKFRELAHALISLGNVTVIFFLGKLELDAFSLGFLPETEHLHRIEEPMESVLPKLAACNLFIGNDSGFYHLAQALGLKTFGLFSRRRSVKVWAYSSARSRAIYFPLPKPFRHHWKKYLSVQNVFKAVVSELKGEAAYK